MKWAAQWLAAEEMAGLVSVTSTITAKVKCSQLTPVDSLRELVKFRMWSLTSMVFCYRAQIIIRGDIFVLLKLFHSTSGCRDIMCL